MDNNALWLLIGVIIGMIIMILFRKEQYELMGRTNTEDRPNVFSNPFPPPPTLSPFGGQQQYQRQPLNPVWRNAWHDNHVDDDDDNYDDDSSDNNNQYVSPIRNKPLGHTPFLSKRFLSSIEEDAPAPEPQLKTATFRIHQYIAHKYFRLNPDDYTWYISRSVLDQVMASNYVKEGEKKPYDPTVIMGSFVVAYDNKSLAEKYPIMLVRNKREKINDWADYINARLIVAYIMEDDSVKEIKYDGLQKTVVSHYEDMVDELMKISQKIDSIDNNIIQDEPHVDLIKENDIHRD